MTCGRSLASPGIPVFSTNKTDIDQRLLKHSKKVALNTITLDDHL